MKWQTSASVNRGEGDSRMRLTGWVADKGVEESNRITVWLRRHITELGQDLVRISEQVF